MRTKLTWNDLACCHCIKNEELTDHSGLEQLQDDALDGDDNDLD